MAKKKRQLSDELTGKSLNWYKHDSQSRRRQNALASRRGNALAAAKALQALVSRTKDTEIARKARADAKYFYMLNAKRGKTKTKRR